MSVVNSRRLNKLIFCIVLLTDRTASTLALAQEDHQKAVPDGSDSASDGANGGLDLDMKLDDLVKQDVVVPGFSQVVNTVERQESTVGRSPAAVFVITPEMIKRSGARNIPEALRMAPGIDVARVN